MNSSVPLEGDPALVVVAGATGDLGRRITEQLRSRGAEVRAPVRSSASTAALEHLAALGVDVVPVDLDDVDALTDVSRGASCVVSALSGLREVILDRQTVLIDAAVRAGVPRFISSDYSADFTRTRPGHNRNFDLRREFAGRADRAPIKVTSILNGAFMDMLGGDMPIVQPRIRSVLYWGDADQPIDLTTREDTAAFTAAAALDPTTPRLLRLAGATVSAREIAAVLTESGGRRFRTVRAGSVRSLAALASIAKAVAPAKPDPTFPAWQGMVYLVDMFSGQARLQPLDNQRYPDLPLTSLADHVERGDLLGVPPAAA